MPIWLISVLVIGTIIAIGNAFAYNARDSLNVVFILMSIFFATNLYIAYIEICLHLRKDSIASRSEYWIAERSASGKSPAVAFLTTVVPWSKLASPTVMADVWAAYTYYDEGYKDRRSVGFVLDIVNGYFSPIPTLILYVAFTNGFLPPIVAGLLGVMMFWQWIYTSTSYWTSFVLAGGHRRISKMETFIWVWSTNFLWIVFPALGLYVSIQLVISGGYSVLGL